MVDMPYVGLSKWQHYWERPESWDESWRLEETCCHSNSCEKPSANTDVKNSKGVNNNNDSLYFLCVSVRISNIIL